MIRDMQPQDVARVSVLEAQLQPQPWQEHSIQQCCQNENYLNRVYISSQTITGYYIAKQQLDVMELLTIGVQSNTQRQGLGSELLKDLFNYARQHQCSDIHLEVRTSNLIAQKLYQQNEFKAVGIRKAYYPPLGHSCFREPNSREDAILMTRHL